MKCCLVLLCIVVLSAYADDDDRIIGGEATSIFTYPYQVSLRTLGNSHFCGGSIISNMWVLTAAHCLVGYTSNMLRIAVGTTNLNVPGAVYGVSELISHPGYNRDNNVNDIALIKMVKPIAFGLNVKPITLSAENPPSGANLTLTGWGLQSFPSNSVSNTLQHINLISVDINYCKGILANFPLTNNHVCTIQTKGKGACKGDSGGPLVYNGVQVGIVSWGIPCAKGYPDVFTSVASYTNWILASTKM